MSSKELKEIRINLKERESNDWPKAKKKKKNEGENNNNNNNNNTRPLGLEP